MLAAHDYHSTNGNLAADDYLVPLCPLCSAQDYFFPLCPLLFISLLIFLPWRPPYLVPACSTRPAVPSFK
jgi:hypothetical protein